MAKQLADQPSGSTFTGNTHVNPKGHSCAITTRSGKVLEREVNEEIVDDEEEVVEKESEVEKNVEGDLVEKETEKSEDKREKIKQGKKHVKSILPVQNLPYPHAPSKKNDARLYHRFMDIFKQLQINIPFAEAIDQMPKYAKFMKDILTKKKRYTEEETIMVDA